MREIEGMESEERGCLSDLEPLLSHIAFRLSGGNSADDDLSPKNDSYVSLDR